MSLSQPVKVRTGLLLVFGLGIGLLALHVGHALGEGEDFQTFLLGILIPMGFALGVLAGGVWLWRQDLDGDDILRVGAWCAVGAIVLAIGAVLTILYEQAEGVIMNDRLFVVVNAASGGAVVGFIVGVYDSRQRRARAEATRLSRQLTVLNRVLRHDLRNDATVIRGSADLLTDETTDIVAQARKIKQQAAELAELGEHAKELERMLRDDDAEREVVDVTSLVETCCDRIRRNYPDADIDVSLPETQLVVAHPLVDSALTNLIENAVEHNDKRIPHVTIDSTPVSHDGTDYVALRIADNGPGIPDSEIDVLERGYETDLDHMSGLGLWLANWIITRSDGDLRFEENDPEGSVACLWLQRAEMNATSATSPSTGDAVSQPS